MFLIRLACSFSIALLLMGCQTTVAWREEVKLNSGEVIVIDRESEHRGGGGPWPFGQGTVPKNYKISFEYPPDSGNIIRWQSTKFDMPRASWAEFPLVLDLDNNKSWFIYTKQWVNSDCIRYVNYRYQYDTWVEVPLSNASIEERDSNLYLGAASNATNGFITLRIKDREMASGRKRKFYLTVGPKQLVPRGDWYECRWNPETQSIEAINIKGKVND